MQPNPSEFGSRGRFRLGDFIFVMGEHQIGSAEMDIDGVAQFFTHHRRTFDVPARASLAPRGWKAGFIHFSPFPKGEIKGVSLSCFFRIGDATRSILLLLTEVSAAELPISRVLHHGEIDIAIR